MAKLIVIDNYDSFTFNLVQMFMDYDLEISVHRSDRIDMAEVDSFDPNYALISPGPRDPSHTGISMPLIKHYYKKIPILGVCLGMQCINEVFGGITVRAPLPVHGKTSIIKHEGHGIFEGIPSNFSAARYHSLMVETADDSILNVSSRSDEVVMGLSHPDYPLHGVQFHPESFMTEHGFKLVENFLKLGLLNI
ncbi:anthranilate synthase component II [Thermodesulfobacteriota bacterium]